MIMSFFIALLIAALFLVAVGALRNKAANEASEDRKHNDLVECPYMRRGPLLTAAERSFLGVIESLIGDRYRIYAQVRLADLVAIRPGTDKRKRQMALNKITSKHVDFVICHPDTLEVLCAIELDDSTHARDDRLARDQFVDAALNSAGLPLVRLVAKAGYQPTEVKKTLEDVMGRLGAQESELPDVVSDAHVVSATTSQMDSISNIDRVPKCPKCNGGTVLRTVKSGARANTKLWGCARFPACRGMVPVPSREAELSMK